MRHLRSEGWTVDVVERWIPVSPAGYRGRIIRKDLFGAFDLVAVRRGSRPKLVQCTSGSNFASRVTKVSEVADELGLSSWADVEIHAWRKPTKTRRRWTLRAERIGLDRNAAA